MTQRQGWSLRPGDLVTFDGQYWMVKKNDRESNAAQIVRDGWIECVRWRWLKLASKVKSDVVSAETKELCYRYQP